MQQKVLENLKIASLNEMQLATIETSKKSNDIILLSPTGSGKTLGFLLPILNSLDKSKEGIQALVIVPSRELAIQIEQVFKQMQTGFKVNCTYGGHSTKTEKNSLGEAPAVLTNQLTPEGDGRAAYREEAAFQCPFPVHRKLVPLDHGRGHHEPGRSGQVSGLLRGFASSW